MGYVAPKRKPMREAPRDSCSAAAGSPPSSSSSPESWETTPTPNSSQTPVAPSADLVERMENGRRFQEALQDIAESVPARAAIDVDYVEAAAAVGGGGRDSDGDASPRNEAARSEGGDGRATNTEYFYCWRSV